MSAPQQTLGRFAYTLTLLVTNAIKIGGLVAAMHEIFSHSAEPRLTVMGLAGFMMAGAQFSEELVLRLWSRMFHPEDELAPQGSRSRPRD